MWLRADVLLSGSLLRYRNTHMQPSCGVTPYWAVVRYASFPASSCSCDASGHVWLFLRGHPPASRGSFPSFLGEFSCSRPLLAARSLRVQNLQLHPRNISKQICFSFYIYRHLFAYRTVSGLARRKQKELSRDHISNSKWGCFLGVTHLSFRLKFELCHLHSCVLVHVDSRDY